MHRRNATMGLLAAATAATAATTTAATPAATTAGTTANAATAPGAPSTARHRALNPTAVSYCQAHEVSGHGRLLFISGQVPADAAGRVPSDFKDQCRLAWANV